MIKNFIVNADKFGVTENEVASIFGNMNGELDPEDDVLFVDASSMEELAVIAEIFPSNSRARKNNFCGPIPHGIHMFGTKKKRFWVWNPEPELEPVIPSSFDHTNRWFQGAE